MCNIIPPMKILTLLILMAFAMVLVSVNVKAEACIQIGPVGSVNGTDANLLREEAINRGTEVSLIAGSSEEYAPFKLKNWRSVINISFLTYFKGENEQIPSTATITNFTIGFTYDSWKGGDAIPQNLRIYPMNWSWNETTILGSDIHPDSGSNMSQWNGTKNLIEDISTLPTGINQPFNYSLNTTWAQNFFDKTLNDWDEGIILINSIAENGSTANIFNSFYSTDNAISAYLPTYYICYSADITPPIINATINNTVPQRYDYINISANLSDETALSYINWTINFTTGLVKNNYSISGTNYQFSNKTQINDTKENVLNITFYASDSSGNTKQNSTLITVANTIPNATYILNASGDYDKFNHTLNLSYCYDPDIDTINYVVYWDLDNTPVSLFTNITTNSFTTNFTSDRTYYFQTKCMDSKSESALSSIWNFTLDTVISTIPNDNLTSLNNSYISGNRTIFIEAYDLNIFNSSINVSKGDIIYEFYYNDTPNAGYLGFLRNINLTVLNDGKYNITFESVDSHSKKIDKTKTSLSKKSEMAIIFIDNSISKEINISTKFFKKNLQPTAIPSNFKSSAEYDNRSYIITQFNFTVENPEISQIITLSTNIDDIKMINSQYRGHLLFGKDYGWEAEGTLLVNGIERNYTVSTTRISKTEMEQEIIPSIPYANNDVVVFTSETLFGLNQIAMYSQVIVDNSLPTISYFNISRFANNSITRQTNFNITVNASDGNPDTAQIYVNDIANSSEIYLNNTDTNISFTIATDGNYTINITINDSAGNKISSSYFYNLVVDTTSPVFANAYNRTADSSNNTNILTTTDVNISVFGVGDIYLDRGNFSYNISNGTWYNVSSFNNGNGTYYTIINKNNLTAGMTGGWKFYVYDLAGNELDPIYTFIVGSSVEGEASPASPSVEGAGPAYGQIQITGENQTNQTIEKNLSQQAMLQLCNANVSFINKLFSKCKIADNGVCDEGESLFIDNDCILKTDDMTTGKIFKYMWLLRFLILLSIFLLAVNNNKFPIAAIALITLLVYNGAFAMAEVSSQTQLNTSLNISIEQPITENGQNPLCMDVNFFINFGSCINPNNPIIGWAIGIALAIAIAAYIFKRKKRRSTKPKSI